MFLNNGGVKRLYKMPMAQTVHRRYTNGTPGDHCHTLVTYILFNFPAPLVPLRVLVKPYNARRGALSMGRGKWRVQFNGGNQVLSPPTPPGHGSDTFDISNSSLVLSHGEIPTTNGSADSISQNSDQPLVIEFDNLNNIFNYHGQNYPGIDILYGALRFAPLVTFKFPPRRVAAR